MSALDRLAAELRDGGGLLGAATRPVADDRDRVADGDDDVALLLEAIREGELLHYRASRVLATDDPDLALLAGDRLYALGLERLAAMGDLEAVASLAELISTSAQAHAEGRPEVADAAFADAARQICDRSGVRSRTSP